MAPFVNLELIKFGILNCGYLADVKVYNIYNEFKTNTIPRQDLQSSKNHSGDNNNVRGSGLGK